MQKSVEKTVEKVIQLLCQSFEKKFADFHGIYVIGLHADGTASEEDDIELVAMFDSEDKSKREEIWPIVGKVETDLDVYIDLTPTTTAELEKDEDLQEEVMQYGIFFDKNGQRK